MFRRILIVFLFLLFPSPPKTKPTCQHLVHLGDSLTVSALRWTASDYTSLGFVDVKVHAINGGSIWYPSGESGVEAARRYKKPQTCWVVALGTNDSSATSAKNWNARYQSLMAVIGTDPVVWVNVWYDSPTRLNYNKNIASWWNAFILGKAGKNIYIYDWAALAKSNRKWFIYDGIHNTSTGARQRSWWISHYAALVLLTK